MGRRPLHSREEFRTLAIDAARSIIAEGGLGALNVRAVATRTGCSVGTIYNSFDGLEDLVAGVNEVTLDGLQEALTRSPVSGDPERDLHALLRQYLDYIQANESNWNLLFEERLPDAGDPPAWYLEKIAELFALLRRILEPVFGAGRQEELDRAVRLLWIGLHGVWSLNAGGHLSIVSPDPPERIARDMVDLYLAGLRARAGDAHSS